ncbi:UNVERIFIED_CONTAM: protein EIN4 [Sesamum latifolium]|uniref:Protein EIN4 n=1 Tax=Sesamum latifolium TaxID=2727402 RepID=A0AAW2VZV5_9LAMI
MSNGLRRPMHSVLGLLSVLQDENLKSEQRLLVDTMVMTSNVLSTLITDVMDISAKDRRFPLEMRGYNFEIDVKKSLPNHVIGDERRVFQGQNEQRWGHRISNSSDGYLHMRVEVGIRHTASQAKYMVPEIPFGGYKYRDAVEEGLSFSACRKLVQKVSIEAWLLVLQFRVRSSILRGISEHGEASDHVHANSLFSGLKVLLADPNDVNRAVTRKFLEKLGCIVSTVSSGYECLSALGPLSSCQILLLDLHLPDVDGLEVAMRLRKFQSHSSPLIVALTANDDEDTRYRCLQTGMNGVIQKSGAFQEIANELKRIVLRANKF